MIGIICILLIFGIAYCLTLLIMLISGVGQKKKSSDTMTISEMSDISRPAKVNGVDAGGTSDEPPKS